MDISTEKHDYKALLFRLQKRMWKLIKIGEAQRARLEAIEAENAELRQQRDMLARRLAQLAHERYGLRYASEAA